MDRPEGDIWIFGYGSLTWKQNFPYCERFDARVVGWRRGFWQRSTDHRGTPADPGLARRRNERQFCWLLNHL